MRPELPGEGAICLINLHQLMIPLASRRDNYPCTEGRKPHYWGTEAKGRTVRKVVWSAGQRAFILLDR